MQEQYYTPAEVALIFGVTRRTVYEWIKQKKMKTTYIAGHRISEEEIERIKKEGI